MLMHAEAPVLLLGFNRPEKMQKLISALRTTSPRTVLVAVDGPRASHIGDPVLVEQVQRSVELIDWTDDVRTLFRNSNMGLRAAVTEAVTWAVSEHGKVIVLEDDCIPGPSCVPFMQWGLNNFSDNQSVAHVNGYNLVPQVALSHPNNQARTTRYIESYAWATWERAWDAYDDSLAWALDSSLSELAAIVGSRTAAMRWKINFHDAASERINTWAYRWMATIWSRGWTVVAPNRNLSNYDGYTGGTHTLRSARWNEPPVRTLDSGWLQSSEETRYDQAADLWTGRNVFHESSTGLVEGLAATAAMAVLKSWRALRERKSNRQRIK